MFLAKNRHLNNETICHKEINPVIRANKSAKPNTLRKVTRLAASAAQKQNAAWARVNKSSHGGNKNGAGRGKQESHAPSRKGGRIGGHAGAAKG